MKIEIDQSGKIEQTNLNTIIALSNDIKYSIILKKRTKRTLQELFRKRGKPRMFIYQTFAALIAILIKETKPATKVIIDMEYLGHQDILTRQIKDYCEKLSGKKAVYFTFGFIGKKSAAHTRAEKVAFKKKKADRVIVLSEIVKIIWPIKNDRVSVC